MNFLTHFFNLKSHNTSVKQEFLAALGTFLAASYLIFVNPEVLSQAGMPKMALITSTILVTVIGTLLVAFIPKLPFVIAPGMGLNAFFVYSLVIGQKIPWQKALAIVFISGLVLTLLCFFRFQQNIMRYFPKSIQIGAMVGIGFFLTLVGLHNIGILESNPSTLIKFKSLTSQSVLGLFSVLLMIVLTIKKVPGAIVISILACSVISIVLGYSPLPSQFFSAPPSIKEIFYQIDFSGIWQWVYIIPLFSLLFIDLFDSMASISTNMGMLPTPSPEKKRKALNRVLAVDAFNSCISATLGNSTTIVYLESLLGVTSGGRTGLTAFFIALFFIGAFFLTPIIAVVPAYASSGALVLIGISMVGTLKQIDFSDLRFAVPAYITAIMMPFTYNISLGIIFGFITYFTIELFTGNIFKVHWINWVITFLCIVNLFLW